MSQSVEVKGSVPHVTFEEFQRFSAQKEISKEDTKNLYDVLTRVDVGVLVDDSPSMCTRIVPDGQNKQYQASSAPVTTRWTEATKLVYTVLQLLVAAKPDDGIDLYFLNRSGPTEHVRTIQDAANFFTQPPSRGATPIIGALSRIFDAHRTPRLGKEYLLVVVTDGEPSDGTPERMKQVLLSKPNHMHLSLAECTDNKEHMDFLEDWNRQIPKFDNTEDYPEELTRIRTLQRNPNYKFSYTDYVVKILLATFFSKYFKVDMPSSSSASPAGCCAVL